MKDLEIDRERETYERMMLNGLDGLDGPDGMGWAAHGRGDII